MVGTPEQPGIMPRALDTLFAYVASRPMLKAAVMVSYIEIYGKGKDQEFVKDLLTPESADNLKVVTHTNRRTGEREVVVKGLTETFVSGKEDALQLMEEGNGRRIFRKTLLNDNSSRSHVIFRIKLLVQNEVDENKARCAIVNLVDLAGSERIGKSGVSGESREEAIGINSSLHQLSNVILALSKGQESVPFRESKLTQILEPSLGGNARTAVICTISPIDYHSDESSNTMDFAQRLSLITNHAKVNEVTDTEVFKKIKGYAMSIGGNTDEMRKEMNRIAVEERKRQHLDSQLAFVSRQLQSLIEQWRTVHDNYIKRTCGEDRRRRRRNSFSEGVRIYDASDLPSNSKTTETSMENNEVKNEMIASLREMVREQKEELTELNNVVLTQRMTIEATIADLEDADSMEMAFREDKTALESQVRELMKQNVEKDEEMKKILEEASFLRGENIQGFSYERLVELNTLVTGYAAKVNKAMTRAEVIRDLEEQNSEYLFREKDREYEERISSFEGNMKKMEETMREKSEELETNQNQLDQTMSHVMELSAEKSDMERMLEDKERESEMMKQEIKQLREKMAAVKTEKNTLETTLSSKVEDLEKELREVKTTQKTTTAPVKGTVRTFSSASASSSSSSSSSVKYSVKENERLNPTPIKSKGPGARHYVPPTKTKGKKTYAATEKMHRPVSMKSRLRGADLSKKISFGSVGETDEEQNDNDLPTSVFD